ncbi:MAG TPA: SgcJ/EcaC family oxidoreductase [Pyrinomonadaceae bacterium]
MSQRIKLLTATLLAFVSIGMLASHAQTPQGSSADDAAIRKIVQQLQDGWNIHSGTAFAAPFASDADYVVVNGMYLKGREAIEKGHTGIFTTVYKDSRNAATIKSLRFLRPDVAVVHVEWNLEFKMGGETKKGHAMNTMVMTREDGKWSIAAFHNTPIEPPRGR